MKSFMNSTIAKAFAGGTSDAEGAKFWECRCSPSPKDIALLEEGGNFVAKVSTGAASSLFPLFAVLVFAVPVFPVPGLPDAAPGCAAVPPARREEADRASVAHAVSCPFTAQSGPVGVASLPSPQIAGLLLGFHPVEEAGRFAGA